MTVCLYFSIFDIRCKRLPRSHLFLLGFLMHHLHRVASEYESNNMTASNLAIVFGPTLLRRNEDTTSMTQVLETIHQARAVELLTIYVQVITVFSTITINFLFIYSLISYDIISNFFNHQFFTANLWTRRKEFTEKLPQVYNK